MIRSGINLDHLGMFVFWDILIYNFPKSDPLIIFVPYLFIYLFLIAVSLMHYHRIHRIEVCSSSRDVDLIETSVCELSAKMVAKCSVLVAETYKIFLF